MNTGRIDFYTKVHKALRASLFQFSARAASVDYADPSALRGLGAVLRELITKLSGHALHEARFIHPLLVEKTGESPFDREHDALEAEQGRLERLLRDVASAREEERRAAGLAFYRALNVFIARYLEHLEREEATMALLWEHCTDEELSRVLAAFGASRSVEEMLADVGWMLPALNPAEQAELISGVSARCSA